MKKTLRKISALGLFLLGSLGLAGKANAIISFDGNDWRGSYPIPANGASITLFNPHGSDTAMTSVDNTGYWIRTPPVGWSLQLGDTVKIKTKDTNGDSARTYRVITFNGNNTVVDLYPNGHSLLVPFVKDGSLDSTDAKCYVKSKQDTLTGRFGRHSYPFDVSFNAPNFPSRSRPVYGDSVVFLISHAGYQTARTALQYKNEFWDADTAASCSLQASGVYEEVDKHDRFVGDLRITPNPFTSFATLPGHEAERFSVYDISGRKIGIFRGDRVGEGLAPGVYFLRSSENKDKPLRIVKVR